MRCKCCNEFFQPMVLRGRSGGGKMLKLKIKNLLTGKKIDNNYFDTICPSCLGITVQDLGYYEDTHEYSHMVYEDILLTVSINGFIGLEEL